MLNIPTLQAVDKQESLDWLPESILGLSACKKSSRSFSCSDDKGAQGKAMAVFVHVEECTELCSADSARAALTAAPVMLLL